MLTGTGKKEGLKQQFSCLQLYRRELNTLVNRGYRLIEVNENQYLLFHKVTVVQASFKGQSFSVISNIRPYISQTNKSFIISRHFYSWLLFPFIHSLKDICLANCTKYPVGI